jgi:hypothetical protein
VKKHRNRMDDPELHRILGDLPSLKAPADLIPNVMSTIRQRQLAWYRRPATSWPPAIQIGAIAAMLGLIAGLLWVFGDRLSGLQTLDLRSLVEVPMAKLIALTGTIEVMLKAFTLIGRTTIGPALLLLTALASISFLALFGMGSALWRAVARVNT